MASKNLSGKNGHPLQFFVKKLDGTTRVLRMPPEVRIADVIESALCDAPRSVRCQVLVKYKNRTVPLEQTLEQTGVRDSDTLYLTGCVRIWRSIGWLRAFELFRRVRDSCRDALSGGSLPGELQEWVKDFLKLVNKECIASEQRILGQIMLEEGGIGQLARHVLGQSGKHPEASVIAVQKCILHILQSCASDLRSTVCHVAGPLFWSLQELPLLRPGHSDVFGRFSTLPDAPGVEKFSSENGPLLTAALRRVLLHGPRSDDQTRSAVRIFCTLVRTVRNQLSRNDPTLEQPPARKKKRWFFNWKKEPAQSKVLVAESKAAPEAYQAEALRACCGFVRTLEPDHGADAFEETVAEIRPLSSDSLLGRPLAERIYTDVEASLLRILTVCYELDARPATALLWALAAVVAIAPVLENRFVSFLETREELVDQLVRLDLAIADGPQDDSVCPATGLYAGDGGPTLLQALCAVPSFTPKLAPETQQQWVRFCTARSDDDEPFHVAVARGPGLLSDAVEQLEDVRKDQLAGGLTVLFEEEEGAGPGLLREFFTLVSRALFDPAAALFAPSLRDRRRFHINPASGMNPGHLAHFALCGRLFGLALANGTPLGVRFSSILYAMLMGPVDDSDTRTLLRNVQDADPELYASCSRLLEMEEAEIIQRIKTNLHRGYQLSYDLARHENLPVSGRNHYVAAAFAQRNLLGRPPLDGAHEGEARGRQLRESRKCVHKEKLCFLGCGWPLNDDLDDVSIADWQKHTEYHELSPTCRHVKWFWQCVEGFTPAQRRRLLFFATSVEFLPPGGFGALPSKFHIWRGGTRDGLPTAHTCFYQLVLPGYKSSYAMRKQLAVIVQSDVWEGFGMR